jgi:MFS transporter, OFA family, oxalate/formate antiporter
MVAIGGVLAGLAWVVDSLATTLPMLYFGGIVAGIGRASSTARVSATR